MTNNAVGTGKNAGNLMGQLSIGLGAVIWGTQGPFAKLIMQSGGNASFASFGKLATGGLILLLALSLKDPKRLKIDRKGLLWTCFLGLVAQAGFNFTYYSAVGLIGIANSAVILYLAPIAFLAYSVVLFKETPTMQKSISAVVCFLGCALAVTGGIFDFSSLSIPGVLLALLSVVSFATMGAFGKLLAEKYDPMTLMVYSFLWGAFFMLPSTMVSGGFAITPNMNLIIGVLGIGMFPAALAYFFYFKGLSFGVPLSKAGVICSMEMVSAVVIAATLFGEEMSIMKWCGVGVILISILMSEYKK